MAEIRAAADQPVQAAEEPPLRKRRRVITRPWAVRFHDGECYDATHGDFINVIAVDGLVNEAFIEFEDRHRKGWWSWESVLWHSDRVFEE